MTAAGRRSSDAATSLSDAVRERGWEVAAVSRTPFRVAPGATPRDGTAKAAAKKAPRGTTLTLRLSEPARVRFEVLVKGKGRKVSRNCVKPTRKNRKRRRCTRLTAKRPVFLRSAPAGRSKVK